MDYSLERITARERLPGTHANVGIRNLRNCFADFYGSIIFPVDGYLWYSIDRIFYCIKKRP